MANQASQSRFRHINTNPPVGGRNDGVAVELDPSGNAAGMFVMESGAPANPINRLSHPFIFEDFIGKALNVTDGVWAVHDTSAAGTPVLAIKADEDNGAFEMAFDATSEAQVLGLYFNDEQGIDSDQGPVMVCRLKIPALNANDILTFGLTSARNSTADSVANHAWFRLEGASLALLLESDDATTDNDDKSTGVTLTSATYYEFMVDARVATDVKFYYRASLGGDWTALTSGTTTFTVGADIALQPNIQLQKSSGTHTTSLLVDYVGVWWKRN